MRPWQPDLLKITSWTSKIKKILDFVAFLGIFVSFFFVIVKTKNSKLNTFYKLWEELQIVWIFVTKYFEIRTNCFKPKQHSDIFFLIRLRIKLVV